MKTTHYTISFDPMMGDYKPSKEESAISKRVYDELQTKRSFSESYLQKLEDYIDQYPNYPTLKNYLALAYSKAGETEAFGALIDEMLEAHPNYFFGRAMATEKYLDERELDKAAELMAGFLTLKELYPEREVFHFSEVKTFHSLATRYFGLKDDESQIIAHLKILKESDVEKSHIKAMAEVAERLQMIGRMTAINKRLERYKPIEGVFRAADQQTEEAPTFNHALIEELYHNDLSISDVMLDRILVLDRATLIDDLDKVAKDAIFRYNYFQETFDEFDESQQSFVVHAVQLLGELRSYDSLQAILDLLRQDDDFTEYWFSDARETLLLRPLYLLGCERIGELMDFIKEPNICWYNRAQAIETLLDIAIQTPARKAEVIAILENVGDYFWQNREDTTIVDGITLSKLVETFTNLGVDIANCKRFFDADLVDITFAGDWNDMLDELANPDTLSPRPISTLYEQYAQFQTSNWYYNYHDTELHPTKKAIFDGYPTNIELSLYEKAFGIETKTPSKNLPIFGGTPTSQNPIFDQKIGRNDRVSVKYKDGRVVADTKFKKVEDDLKNGKCELITV